MNLELMKQYLSCKDNKVFDMMLSNKFLVGKYTYISDGDNYLFLIPIECSQRVPCLVAHIDKAVYTTDYKVVLECGSGVISNKHGILGADDRAGCFIIHEIVDKLDELPFILLTNYEEVGGVGAKMFCKDSTIEMKYKDKSYLDYISCFIEFDRKGVDEYVYYSDSLPAELKTIADSHGMKESYGTYSDVSTLTEYYKTAHLNLSACYYKEHTVKEYLVYDLLPAVMGRYISMLNCIIADGSRYEATVNDYDYYDYRYAYAAGAKPKKKDDSEYIKTWESYYDDKTDTNEEYEEEVDGRVYCSGCFEKFEEVYDGLCIDCFENYFGDII